MIMSANVQGLSSREKRKDVFSYIRNSNYNIFCLQDTHFTEDKEEFIKNEWGYTCNAYFSSFRGNSRGVAILFNNNFEFKVHKEKIDKTGNILALEIEIEGSHILLVNIYGPNQDSPDFYAKISDILEEFNCAHVIICGDFNLVLNPDLDYDNTYKNINNPKARDKILEIIDNFGLIDVFREQHENVKRFTWRKKNPIKQARLDYIVSESLLPSVNYSGIDPGYRSDHSFPKILMKLNNLKEVKELGNLITHLHMI